MRPRPDAKSRERELLVELNADGTDYVVASQEPTDTFQENWDVLRRVFDAADAR
jgi:hypothetical protein